jgi:hypothetical protein
MHTVKGPKTLANYGFQVSIWGVLLVALGIGIAGCIDLAFGLRWGFAQKDVIMAIVVIAITILVKFIGMKIISAMGGF